MSDQETAIQLIRNEAAELIVRAKAAGLGIRIYETAGVYAVSVIVPVATVPPSNDFGEFCAQEIKKLREEIKNTSPRDLLGPDNAAPIGNLFFCSGDRNALKPDVGNRRFAVIEGLPCGEAIRCEGYLALDTDVEPSASGNGLHIFAKEPK